MKKILKITSRFVRILIILAAFFAFESRGKLLENKVINNNLNKSLDLETMAVMISNLTEEDNALNYQEEIVEKINEEDTSLRMPTELDSSYYEPLNTVTGKLTGYVYNCPLCGGTLACKPSYDITSGNVFYDDITYGSVRIVASSSNLPCGSIVRFDKLSVSQTPIIAIVLDRGVTGDTLDLLVESTEYAFSYVGRSEVTYDVLRLGW